MKKLDSAFYQRKDVLKIARDLIGKVLITIHDGELTSGRIVETEAYAGVADRASHAYGGRRTSRTEIMFAPGGHAYVYLCYGIHHLFNVVTNTADIPHVVLVRALEPMEGIDVMYKRSGILKDPYGLTSGPGNLSRALGIRIEQSGTSLLSEHMFIAEDDYRPGKSAIITTPRIGVDSAGEAATWMYRFIHKNSPWVSARSVNRKYIR